MLMQPTIELTTDQKEALQGTTGDPSNVDRYVTDLDPRISLATTIKDGITSAADKTKLDGIQSNATANIITSIAPVNVTKAAAVVGSSNELARQDHKHDISTAVVGASTPGASASEGTATTLARSDHDHSLPAFGTTSGTFAQGNDSRFTTLALHAATHAAAGTDPVTLSESQITGLIADLAAKVNTSLLGANSGVATLDASGKIPASQLTVEAMSYKGMWNASTDVPTISDATGTLGDLYICSVGATRNLGSGNIVFTASSWVIHNGTIWQQVASSSAVTSVDGQTGVVNTLTAATPTDVAKSAAAVGVATLAARADHKHDVTTATPSALAIGSTNTEGTATTLARADHIHTITGGTPVALGTVNAAGSLTTFSRADHVHAHGVQTDTTLHALATTSAPGFMSALDKQNLASFITPGALSANRYHIYTPASPLATTVTTFTTFDTWTATALPAATYIVRWCFKFSTNAYQYAENMQLLVDGVVNSDLTMAVSFSATERISAMAVTTLTTATAADHIFLVRIRATTNAQSVSMYSSYVELIQVV
jgi:hypothetical protein